MKLFEYLSQGKFINKQAKLTKSITLDNGEFRNKGDEVTIVKDNADGTFHAEDNDFACKVQFDEFKYIKG
jgi:hypothetical protein